MRPVLNPLLQLRLIAWEALWPLAMKKIDVFEKRKHERGLQIAVFHIDRLVKSDAVGILLACG